MRSIQNFLPRACCAVLIASLHIAASAQERGTNFVEARASLLKQGWEPRATSVRMKDGSLEKSFGEARSFLQAGFAEVESCTGTGLNHCRFNYRRGEECLVLVTQGEWRPGSGSPVVLRTETSCV